MTMTVERIFGSRRTSPCAGLDGTTNAPIPQTGLVLYNKTRRFARPQDSSTSETNWRICPASNAAARFCLSDRAIQVGKSQSLSSATI